MHMWGHEKNTIEGFSEGASSRDLLL